MNLRTPAFAFLAAVVTAGCGTRGPEVRTSPDAASWKPAFAVLLPASMAAGAVPAGQTLPAGLVRPTDGEALSKVWGALCAELREKSGVPLLEPFSVTVTAKGEPVLVPGADARFAFSGTSTAQEIVQVAGQAARQYLEARAVEPPLAARLGSALGTEAVLLTAILRYGPEVEGNLATMQQSVGTQVGNSQLSISSSASSAVVYFNVHFRCALVRCSDGAVLWDASVRKRQKRMKLLDVTQESMLDGAVRELAGAFPYLRASPGGATGF